MANSEAPFRCNWDGHSRRAAHARSGLGVRSERAIRRCIRCAAESRCAAAARSGIIGLTIRDSSCCHWMAVGIRRMRGRLSAARSCVCSAAKCVRLRRRGCDGFVLFTHSAWVWRASPVAIRWLGSDLRSGQRREYRPNMPAPALRRVVASGSLQAASIGHEEDRCSKMFRNVQKCSETFKNVQKCSKMFTNVPKCSRMFINVRI